MEIELEPTMSLHDDFMSPLVPPECFSPRCSTGHGSLTKLEISSKSLPATPRSPTPRGANMAYPGPKRLQNWPLTRRTLKALIVTVIAFVQSLQWWITATNTIQFACRLSHSYNSSSPFFLPVGICRAVAENPDLKQEDSGNYFQSEQVSFWNRRLDEHEASLRQIQGYLGLDVEVDHDVALRGSGAMIIPELTSPTHSLQTRIAGLWFWFQSTPTDVVRPEVILEETTILGECWEFSGRYGIAGIRLPAPTKITALSVHYIPANRLSQNAKQKAPKSLTLWGLVPASQFYDLSLGSDLIESETRTAQDFASILSRAGQLPKEINKEDRFLPILRAKYDLNLNPRYTVFVEQDDIDQSEDNLNGRGIIHNLSFDVLIVESTENWGANTTCLYHVGIHGTTL